MTNISLLWVWGVLSVVDNQNDENERCAEKYGKKLSICCILYQKEKELKKKKNCSCHESESSSSGALSGASSDPNIHYLTHLGHKKEINSWKTTFNNCFGIYPKLLDFFLDGIWNYDVTIRFFLFYIYSKFTYIFENTVWHFCLNVSLYLLKIYFFCDTCQRGVFFFFLCAFFFYSFHR